MITFIIVVGIIVAIVVIMDSRRWPDGDDTVVIPVYLTVEQTVYMK